MLNINQLIIIHIILSDQINKHVTIVMLHN